MLARRGKGLRGLESPEAIITVQLDDLDGTAASNKITTIQYQFNNTFFLITRNDPKASIADYHRPCDR